jgi:hypothetical protein
MLVESFPQVSDDVLQFPTVFVGDDPRGQSLNPIYETTFWHSEPNNILTAKVRGEHTVLALRIVTFL